MVISTQRLLLTPIEVRDAADMVHVLDDPSLYRFTGGRPPDSGELERRYRRQQVGASLDGTESWRNWVVRRRSDGTAIGYVQATIHLESGVAELAWVVGTPWQGNGYAREAARAMRDTLAEDGITRFAAHIHPAHDASAAVARVLGLAPSGRTFEGEDEWVSGDDEG